MTLFFFILFYFSVDKRVPSIRRRWKRIRKGGACGPLDIPRWTVTGK